MARTIAKLKSNNSTANLGFEAKLWLAADKLCNNMDAFEPERSGDSQPKAARTLRHAAAQAVERGVDCGPNSKLNRI